MLLIEKWGKYLATKQIILYDCDTDIIDIIMMCYQCFFYLVTISIPS